MRLPRLERTTGIDYKIDIRQFTFEAVRPAVQKSGPNGPLFEEDEKSLGKSGDFGCFGHD